MTEETETTEHKSTTPVDDPRFEVKWRKKGSPSPAPPPAVEQPAAQEPRVEGGNAEDPASLRRQLDEAREQIRNLQDRWQRSAADLANLRRRTEQEKGEVEKFASMVLVAELLPVLDNFERALTTIPGNLQMLTWIQGVMLIERHFRALLEQRGVEPIEADGQPFNPALHEAIAERETADVGPGHVVQVYQGGYTMHGRVIRPALVEISAPPAAAPKPTDASEDAIEEAETENVGP